MPYKKTHRGHTLGTPEAGQDTMGTLAQRHVDTLGTQGKLETGLSILCIPLSPDTLLIFSESSNSIAFLKSTTLLLEDLISYCSILRPAFTLL